MLKHEEVISLELNGQVKNLTSKPFKANLTVMLGDNYNL